MNDKTESTENEEGVRLNFTKIDEYVTGVSGSGKRTKNNGDDVAQAVDGFNLEELEIVATKLGIELNDYSHLNYGMQVMNTRNRIRGAVNGLEKEEEGSGFAALEKSITKTMRKTVDKRLAALAAEAKEKADARAAKKAEKEAAEKAA